MYKHLIKNSQYYVHLCGNDKVKKHLGFDFNCLRIKEIIKRRCKPAKWGFQQWPAHIMYWYYSFPSKISKPACKILNQLALSYQQQRDIGVLLYNWHDTSYMTLLTIVKVKMNTTCTLIISKHAHIHKKKSALWEMKGLRVHCRHLSCPTWSKFSGLVMVRVNFNDAKDSLFIIHSNTISSNSGKNNIHRELEA